MVHLQCTNIFQVQKTMVGTLAESVLSHCQNDMWHMLHLSCSFKSMCLFLWVTSPEKKKKNHQSFGSLSPIIHMRTGATQYGWLASQRGPLIKTSDCQVPGEQGHLTSLVWGGTEHALKQRSINGYSLPPWMTCKQMLVPDSFQVLMPVSVLTYTLGFVSREEDFPSLNSRGSSSAVLEGLSISYQWRILKMSCNRIHCFVYSTFIRSEEWAHIFHTHLSCYCDSSLWFFWLYWELTYNTVLVKGVHIDTLIWCKMLTTVELTNTSIISH